MFPRRLTNCWLTVVLALVLTSVVEVALRAQTDDVAPVTDAMLQDPAPDDWLMWRRTLNGWGIQPARPDRSCERG